MSTAGLPETPSQIKNNQLLNSYLTPKGWVTVYPQVSTRNNFGFVLRIKEPSTEFPNNGELAVLISWLQSGLLSLITTIFSFLKCSPSVHPPYFRQIVPPDLRWHLIVTTPPVGSPLSILHGQNKETRMWFTPASTQSIVWSLRQKTPPRSPLPSTPVTW